MKTLVWDNQQAYSNHSIWFIELAPDEDVAEAIHVLELYNEHEQSKVKAVIDDMTWRVPKGTATMDEWLEEYAITLVDLLRNDDEDRLVALCHLPVMWRKKIADALSKSVSDAGYHKDYIAEAEAIVADLTNV